LGAIVTSGNDDVMTRVIVGAGAGCALAMGANYFLQSKRDKYASEEEKMQAVLSNIKQENEKLTKLVSSSKAVVEEDKRKIAQVKEAYRSNQISLEEANAQLKDVDSNKAYLEKTLSNLEEREGQWIELGRTLSESQPQSDMQEMDKEIAHLQGNIELLKNELETLEEARDISTIG
jgi:chromosome segregation ATPase